MGMHPSFGAASAQKKVSGRASLERRTSLQACDTCLDLPSALPLTTPFRPPTTHHHRHTPTVCHRKHTHHYKHDWYSFDFAPASVSLGKCSEAEEGKGGKGVGVPRSRQAQASPLNHTLPHHPQVDSATANAGDMNLDASYNSAAPAAAAASWPRPFPLPLPPGASPRRPLGPAR